MIIVANSLSSINKQKELPTQMGAHCQTEPYPHFAGDSLDTKGLRITQAVEVQLTAQSRHGR